MDNTVQQKKKLSELDYASLSQPVTKADITAFRLAHEPQRPWVKLGLRVGYIVIGIVTIGVVWLGIALLSHNSLSTSFMPFLLWVPVVGGTIYMVHFMINKRYRLLVRLDRFATRNGLKFKYDTSVAAYYPGMIFDEGRSRQLREVLIFPETGEVGNYSYVTGSGKNQTTHHWAYLKLKLPRRLPHMVLDAKKNNFFGKFSNLTDTFDKSQTLSLEGDFNEHFTLYAPKQYERDALYVFTPDVMATLIDNGSNYDMEVIDDELYLYRSGTINLSSELELRSLVAIAEAIATDLHKQTDYYADERVADRAQNMVAPQGIRLKRGINWFTVILFILIIWFFFQPHIESFLKR